MPSYIPARTSLYFPSFYLHFKPVVFGRVYLFPQPRISHTPSHPLSWINFSYSFSHILPSLNHSFSLHISGTYLLKCLGILCHLLLNRLKTLCSVTHSFTLLSLSISWVDQAFSGIFHPIHKQHSELSAPVMFTVPLHADFSDLSLRYPNVCKANSHFN